MKYINRETIDIELCNLPFKNNSTLRLIEASKLKIIIHEDEPPIDIGAWCYTKRKIRVRDSNLKPGTRLVVQSSFLKSRRKFIIKYAEYLYIQYTLGKSLTTILSLHSVFQRYVIWCDTHQINTFSNSNAMRNSFIQYTADLNEKIKTNILTINSASIYQMSVKTVLDFITDISDGSFLSGIPAIKRRFSVTTPTPPPDKSNASEALNIYMLLFTQTHDFIISFKKYPLKLNIGTEFVWVFPNTRLLATKQMLENRGNWKRKYYPYNFKNGTIYNLRNVLANKKTYTQHQKKHYIKDIAIAKNKILTANTNKFHPRRLSLATLCQQSFIMMFSVNTGMNLSSMKNQIWNEKNLKIGSTSQGFKSIKNRAGNKETEFHIENKFYPAFKQYLEIRKYILSALDNTTCNLLFFKIVNNKITPLGMGLSYNYNNRIENLFGINISIGTRTWRSHKSDWLIKNTDIYTSSLILQNSPETVIKSYIAGSETRAEEELANFYSQFTKKTIIKDSNKSTETSVGRCKKVNSPKKASKLKHFIEPNCKTPEGCLFCTQYAIVADEEDIRKILSLNYIVLESRSLSSSDAHFDAVFGKVIRQIQHIIKLLIRVCPHVKTLISTIENEIFQEERLSPYWERKLKLLIDLEVIA